MARPIAITINNGLSRPCRAVEATEKLQHETKTGAFLGPVEKHPQSRETLRSGQLRKRFGQGFELADRLLAERTGMKAPSSRTTMIVPKKATATPVYGSIRNGASTPAKMRPNASPKTLPRPRNAVGNCSDR